MKQAEIADSCRSCFQSLVIKDAALCLLYQLTISEEPEIVSVWREMETLHGARAIADFKKSVKDAFESGLGLFLPWAIYTMGGINRRFYVLLTNKPELIVRSSQPCSHAAPEHAFALMELNKFFGGLLEEE